MKRLLRGIIDFKGITDEALKANYHRVLESGIEWVRADERKIFDFVKTFFEHHLAMPSAVLVEEHFTKTDELDVTEHLKVIAEAKAYDHQNFIHVVRGIRDDQNKHKMAKLCKETEEIAVKGLTRKKGREEVRLDGVKDALIYFTEHSQELIPSASNATTRGNIRANTQELWNQYVLAKSDKSQAWGAFTGIDHIDEKCHGIKKGELWVHAGFAGELKSTFAQNWAYNLVTRYRRNVFYVSLEMPYKQIRLIMAVMHSANGKFKAQGHVPLDYCKVRDGELTPEEEIFYQEVLKDFETNPEYCRFEIWCPDRDVTINDIKLETEIMHQKMDVGLLVIDHGGLVTAAKANSNYTVELNTVLRDSKKLALHFHGGEGIPVVLLFQINRDGKDMADKNEGVYQMRALSYSNEAERSADVISTTYLNDEHREHGTSKTCCLKNRDNPLFAPTLVGVNFSCRRIQNYIVSGIEGHGMDGDDPLEALGVC
jgi:replicative DNA helicase